MTKYTEEDVLEVLKRAKNKISRKGGWIKGTWNAKVPNEDMYAYCATGAVGSAVHEITGERNKSLRRRAVKRLQDALPRSWRAEGYGADSVESYNDTRDSVKDVIELFGRGIAAVEKDLKE